MVAQALIPALRKQRQVDLYEFKASLAYRVSPGTGSKATEKLRLEKQKNKTRQKYNR